MQDVKTRFWTRLSFAALALALLAGAFTSGVLINANADAQPDAQPEPRRTAYIDFLSLLKKDKPLAREQIKIAEEVELEMAEIEKLWGEEIKAQEEIKRRKNPDTREYRKAMEQQLEAARKMYEAKLSYEQSAQEDLRRFGIERFQALQNLARDEARQRGYNEVLNIVRRIEDVSGQQDSFQALQQQLLISPVLYFEEAHDITDAVQAAAEKQWGSTISITPYSTESGQGGVRFTLKGSAEPLKRNAAGELEIRLGQEGAFSVELLDKGAPAAGAAAELEWLKRGLDTGDLSKQGEYKAPADFPAGEDTFTVRVRSKLDPTISEEVTIRLLDKDGRTMPPRDK